MAIEGVEGAWGTLKGIGEGLEETGGVREETVEKVNEAEEVLKVLNSLWPGVVQNGVHVGGEGSDAGGSDLVAKERDRRLDKAAKVHLERLTRRSLARRISRSCVKWKRCWERLGLATRMSSR